jgi:hypothetical protein
MRGHHGRVLVAALAVALAGCSPTPGGTGTPGGTEPAAEPVTSTLSPPSKAEQIIADGAPTSFAATE